MTKPTSPESVKVAIQPLADKDMDALFAFFQNNGSNGHLFQTYWQWRNQVTARWGGEKAVIAKAEGNITACLGMVPALMTFDGTLFDGQWQQDSLVHASMRGQGIGGRLIDAGGHGCDLVLAKGTSHGMYRLRIKKGFKDVPKSNFLLRVLRPRSRRIAARQMVSEWLLAAWSIGVPPIRAPRNIVVERIDHFDEGFDRLSRKVSQEQVFRLEKSAGYLNWRYTRCPGRQYTIYRAKSGKKVAAIVLSLAGQDRQEGWIVDLICESYEPSMAYALLKTSIRFFKKNRVMRIWCFSTAPWARKWLFRCGFVPTDRSPRFTFRSHMSIDVHGGLSQKAWDFWHGDGDVELYS